MKYLVVRKATMNSNYEGGRLVKYRRKKYVQCYLAVKLYFYLYKLKFYFVSLNSLMMVGRFVQQICER